MTGTVVLVTGGTGGISSGSGIFANIPRYTQLL
jgi:hypothetical protein